MRRQASSMPDRKRPQRLDSGVSLLVRAENFFKSFKKIASSPRPIVDLIGSIPPCASAIGRPPPRGMFSATRASRVVTMKLSRPVALSIAAAALAACCASLRPISATPVIDGRPAHALTVVLGAPFSFKHFLSTYTLPAGRYEPTLEDDSGAYFAAPTKIIAAEALAAWSLYDGGLYFRTDGSKQVEAYVIVRNQPLFRALPDGFPYALEARADAR